MRLKEMVDGGLKRLKAGVKANVGTMLALFGLNFFTIVWQNIHQYGWTQLSVLVVDACFLLAMVIILVALLGLLPIKINKWLSRILVGLAILLALLDLFAIYSYQCLVGAGIITALLQTNFHEAIEFCQMYVGWTGLILLIMVGILLWQVRWWWLSYSQKVTLTPKSKSCLKYALALIVLLGIGASDCLWRNYHSFVVNNSLDIPAVRIGRSLMVSWQNMTAFAKLQADANKDVTITENESDVPYVVFILGESTNRSRLHLYGYPLENTPNLDELAKKGDIAVFRDVISSQGATVASLRELFTFHDVEATDEWYTYNNLIDVMRAAGYRTYWLSNQESSGIWGNVAQMLASRSDVKRFTQLRESHEDNGKLDEDLFPLVDEALQTSSSKNFYVIHLMGGHSLYYLRFPYMFSKFTKDDIKDDQANLSDDRRTEIAQYENALFYNDFIVSSLIGKFADKEALVIYLPDHGETVYDDGGNLAGHVEENPNRQQLEVPLIIWGSPLYKEKNAAKWQQICAAVNRPYMTDDMIHTILDLLNIKTPEYDNTKSLVNPNFNEKRPRIVRGKDYDLVLKGKNSE